MESESWGPCAWVMLGVLPMVGYLLYTAFADAAAAPSMLKTAVGRLGTEVSGDAFRVTLKLGGRPAVLSRRASTDGLGATRLEVDLGCEGWFRIRPHGPALPRMPGVQDLQVGDPEIDHRYLIEAVPVDLVPEMMTPLVRNNIRLLAAFELILLLSAGRLVLQLARDAAEAPTAIGAMLELGADIAGSLTAARVSMALERVAVPGGNCPTCGTALRDVSAVCVKCGGRQHPECWEYFGTCATYACGGRQWRRS